MYDIHVKHRCFTTSAAALTWGGTEGSGSIRKVEQSV